MSSLKLESVGDINLQGSQPYKETRGTELSYWRVGLKRFAVSLLLFGLFSEWLYPLFSLIDEGQNKIVHLFVVLTAGLLLIGCFHMPKLLYAPLPVLFIAGSMYFFYGGIEGLHWYTEYSEILIQDVMKLVQSGRLNGISVESRMLLLLIGWSLLVVSVQMLALGRGSILLFFSVTLLYLWVLEIAVEINITSGFIRTAAWGLGLQMLIFRNHISSMLWSHRKGVRKAQHRVNYVIVASVVLSVCVLGAAMLTSLLPIQPTRKIPWDHAMQALEKWNGSYGEEKWNAYSTSGYSRDDSELGAPLKLRHDPYFTAVSPQRTYWRGESKILYTGRGWTQPVLDSELQNHLIEITSSDLNNSHEIHGDEIKQTVIFEEPQPVGSGSPLFGGGLPLTVGMVFSGEAAEQSVQATAKYDESADAVYIEQLKQQGTGAQFLWGYELTSKLQSYSDVELHSSVGPDPEEIRRLYLQLPEKLPDRVRKLGIDLAEQGENRYEAVLEVMSYLKGNYTYSLDSARPSQRKDFVDSFLFEQKSGYCDHFSTSMTVLLRSAGIPSRWVKGFAPGDPVSESGNRYVISYADAHAWVEVYFPGIGWVPFDPTPGYESLSIPGSVDADSGMMSTGGSIWTKVVFTVNSVKSSMLAVLQPWWNSAKNVTVDVLLITFSAGLVLLVALMNQKKLVRKQWFRLRMMALKLRRRFPDQKELLAAADVVWRELYLLYGTKPPAMTAREYVDYIGHGREKSSVFAGIEQFVDVWETIYYGGIRLNRTQSKNFLKQCLDLAFSSR
ncbi:Protein-glutamine gamma-glutamyltransferase [compost metagenome]